MTLTLTPEMEAALNAAAQERGATPEEIVLETLTKKFLPQTGGETLTPEEKERRKQEAMALIESGYFARLLGPSRLLEDKADEIAREERRWK